MCYDSCLFLAAHGSFTQHWPCFLFNNAYMVRSMMDTPEQVCWLCFYFVLQESWVYIWEILVVRVRDCMVLVFGSDVFLNTWVHEYHLVTLAKIDW